MARGRAPPGTRPWARGKRRPRLRWPPRTAVTTLSLRQGPGEAVVPCSPPARPHLAAPSIVCGSLIHLGGRTRLFCDNDMWALDVIWMVVNLELYQTLTITWSCFTLELHGSAALKLFLRSWSSAKCQTRPNLSGWEGVNSHGSVTVGL
jgi:hypothetical protein